MAAIKIIKTLVTKKILNLQLKIYAFFLILAKFFLRRIKLFLWILVCVVIPPLVIAFYLFPLNKKINLTSGMNPSVTIAEQDFTQPSWESAVADAIAVPLQLKWYDVYLKNSSYYSNSSPGFAPDAGSPFLEFGFIKGNPEVYGKIMSYDKGCYRLKDGSLTSGKYCLANQETAHFLYSATEEFTLSFFFLGQGKQTDYLNDDTKNQLEGRYELYAEYNVIAWFAKLIFIFIFWIFFLASILGIWEFGKRFIRKTNV